MKFIKKEGYYKVVRIKDSALKDYISKGWKECDIHGNGLKQKKDKGDDNVRQSSENIKVGKKRSSS